MRIGGKTLTIGKDAMYEKHRLHDLLIKKGKGEKLLFINPPVDFSVFYSDMDLSDTKSSSPPVGILHLASMAREWGYDVKILDAHAENATIKDIEKLIFDYEPDYVCLTAMTIMIDASAQIAKAVKKIDPRITTIIGGVHVTAEPEETMRRYPEFDYAVIGEGEIVLLDFLQRDSNASVKSLVWRNKGEIVKNERRSFYRELDDFPFPAFDLVGEKLFSHYRLSVFGTKEFRSIGLVTSRGCTGLCTFCLTGDTLVLTQDLRWVKIESIKLGDKLVGIETKNKKGSYRRYVDSEVTHVFDTRKEKVYKIVTDNGEVEATADHPWLTEVGRWRTTSQLKIGWKIKKISNAEESPEITQDYRQGYICGAIKSDGYFKRYKLKDGRIHPRCQIVGDHEMMDTCLKYSEELGVPLNKSKFNGGMYKKITYKASSYSYSTFDEIESWFDNPSKEFKRGFIAGYFDGDGSWTSAIRFHGKNEEEMIALNRLLKSCGFEFKISYSTCGKIDLTIQGGVSESIRLMSWCQPKVQRKWKFWNKKPTYRGFTTIRSVDYVGIKDVYNIETSSHTFIANGFISHNCDLGVVGRGYRIMSAPYLINNLKELNRLYDVDDLLFYDDMFTGNRKRLEEFCHAMIEAGNPFTWSCCSRVDFVQYLDIIELMRDAGCHTIEFGVESGCQRILDSMRKNVTKEKIAHVIDTATRAGIQTKANFILGHLGETHDSIEETIEFACSLNVNYVQHTHLIPLPGSEIHSMASKYGEFDPSWLKCNTFLINFIPKGFTREQLVGYSKKFWRKFYLRPRIIWQEIKKIKRKEDLKRLWLAIISFFKVTVMRKQKIGIIH